jgi:hypothetical protein
MKKHILFLSMITFSILLSFTACKKDSSSEDNTAEISTQSDDQSRFASEVDAVANDADFAIESSVSFSSRGQGIQGIICDASIALDTVNNPKTITITYDGTNCFGNRTRTGVVIVSKAQGVQWKNAGAAVTVTFQNLKITRVSDNKSIIINGTQTYTNTSGGLLSNLLALGTITHSITSNGLSVKFDDATQRVWQVAKQRVFTYDGGVVITSTGTHTDGSNTHIAEWGTNRFGRTFFSSTPEPLIVRQDCNVRLTSGQVKHITGGVTATVTFGLDANGSPTTCPGTGHYYLKIVWTGPSGNSLSVIYPY